MVRAETETPRKGASQAARVFIDYPQSDVHGSVSYRLWDTSRLLRMIAEDEVPDLSSRDRYTLLMEAAAQIDRNSLAALAQERAMEALVAENRTYRRKEQARAVTERAAAHVARVLAVAA